MQREGVGRRGRHASRYISWRVPAAVARAALVCAGVVDTWSELHQKHCKINRPQHEKPCAVHQHIPEP